MWELTFRANRFAQGAGIAIILLVIVSLLIVPYLRYSLRREVEA
jgi:glucose/mannose transport system permease protein